jgi:hypothetical protein
VLFTTLMDSRRPCAPSGTVHTSYLGCTRANLTISKFLREMAAPGQRYGQDQETVVI